MEHLSLQQTGGVAAMQLPREWVEGMRESYLTVDCDTQGTY